MAMAVRVRACLRVAINSPEFNAIDAVIRGGVCRATRPMNAQ